MKSFSATTTINASPETIWEILTNANGYPDWEPGIDRIEGHIALERRKSKSPTRRKQTMSNQNGGLLFFAGFVTGGVIGAELGFTPGSPIGSGNTRPNKR